MPTDMEKMRAKAQENREQKRQRRPQGNVSVSKGKSKPKRINIECLYEGDDVVYIHFDKLEHATKKSVLVVIGDRKEWIPFSQLRDIDVDDCVVVCSEWIAGEKGLESDW